MAHEHPVSATTRRGPSEHAIRDQIVTAANDYFSHFGYGKTTMNDLAKSIGFSKAYIYKFFDSKQSIGEAICSQQLAKISTAAEEAISSNRLASHKLRSYFQTIIEKNVELFFVDRQLYDIATHSTSENWPSSVAHAQRLEQVLESIIIGGRESGEFEKKTPIDETCRAIVQAMQPFFHPAMLEHNLAAVPNGSNEVISLILRSLAP
ncbi:TetR/AcrR family transcriptional regulator [Neorhizobium sp. LMR1-1-1.1]